MAYIMNNCAGLSKRYCGNNSKDFLEKIEDIEKKVKTWNNMGGKYKTYNIVKFTRDNKVYYYDKKKNGVGLVYTIIYDKE